MNTPLESLAEELGIKPDQLREDALELLYMQIGFRPGDQVVYAGSTWEVAEIKKFPHGWMVGIYDEPPGKHVDYIKPESVTKIPRDKLHTKFHIEAILSSRGDRWADLEVDLIQEKIDAEKFFYSCSASLDAVRDMENSFIYIVSEFLDLGPEFVAAFTE